MSFVFQYLRSYGDNFGVVIPGLIYRSAEPSRDRLEEWASKYRLEAVLNLRAEAKDEEQEEVESLGLKWLHVPMVDDVEPSDGQVRKALDYLRLGKTILICCTGGRHRTSLISSVYLVVEKHLTKKDAWKLNSKFGWYGANGHQPLKDWYDDFIPEEFSLATVIVSKKENL